MRGFRKWSWVALLIGQLSLAHASALNDPFRSWHLDFVKELLLDKSDADAQDIYSEAIFFHMLQDNREIIPDLIKAGANVNHPHKHYGTLLLYAAEHCSLGIVEELLMGKADIAADPYGNGFTPLQAAKMKRRADKIAIFRKWLIENQILIVSPQDVEILDRDDPGSFQIEFAQRIFDAIAKATDIPAAPVGIIQEYLMDTGSIQNPRPKKKQRITS